MTSSRLRKLLIALGAVLLLAAAALAWLIASFDPNAYKGQAVDWMKNRHDRHLVIGGPIRLSVFPRLEVELSDVRLSERGRTDEFAALYQAALSVRLLPLLSKRLEVDRVEARGLRLVYTRDAQGRANIDDLLEKPVEPPPEDGGAGGRRMHFDVASVQLADLRLTLRDELRQLAGVLTLADFKTGRLADGVESPLQLDARLALDSPPVQGSLSGKTLLALDLDAGSVRLREMQLGWKGDALGTRGLDLQLQGGLAYDGRTGSVQAERLALRLGATLGSLRLDDSRLALKTFRFEPQARRLALDGLALKLAGTQGGHPLGLNLDWPRLDVQGEQLGGSGLAGRLSLQGPFTLEADFKSAAPSGNFEQIRIPGFEAQLKGRSGPRQLGGQLGADLLLQVARKALSLDQLQARLQIQEPSLQALLVSLRGQAWAAGAGAHGKIESAKKNQN